MKIKFGSFIVAGSGKIGGHVAAKNRGGSYLRTKISPSNPQTTAQSSARALFASFSIGWANLTQQARDSFIGAVSSFATTDIFGDSRNPSGLNLFVKLNVNASRGGFPPVNIAPEKVDLPYEGVATAELSGLTGLITLSFNGSALNGKKIIVWGSPSMSAGRKFIKNEMRSLGVVTVGLDSAMLPDAYLAKFGVATPGANVQLGYQVVVSTGQASTMYTAKASVF